MLLLQSTTREALEKLTTGSAWLSDYSAPFILEDIINFAEGLNTPYALDIDAIKNSWMEESEEYVLDAYDVDTLEEITDIHYLQPGGAGTLVAYTHLDDNKGIILLTEDE